MIDLEFVGDYRQPQLSARQRELGHDGSSAGEFSFDDFIDIINPLQHIPIVSTLYREITGDEISPHARIFGDTLFGGPMGFVSAIANAFYEEVAGEDPGETLLAFFTGDDGADEPQFAEGDLAVDLEVVPAADAVTDLPAAALQPPLETAAAPAAEANAAAVLPEPAPGMLTGQDALNALFRDLGGGQAAAPPPPTAAAAQAQTQVHTQAQVQAGAAKSYPLPPRHIPVGPASPAPAAATPADNPAAAAAGHPLLFAQEAGEAALADRMMQALDKYQAMSQQTRRGADREDRDDNDKRVIWQSDPAETNGS